MDIGYLTPITGIATVLNKWCIAFKVERDNSLENSQTFTLWDPDTRNWTCVQILFDYTCRNDPCIIIAALLQLRDLTSCQEYPPPTHTHTRPYPCYLYLSVYYADDRVVSVSVRNKVSQQYGLLSARPWQKPVLTINPQLQASAEMKVRLMLRISHWPHTCIPRL